MALPALALYLLLAYGPLPGIVLAFKRFNLRAGIWASPWNGIGNFLSYFSGDDFRRTTLNTLWINLNNWLWETVAAVVLAILLNEIRQRLVKRAYQFFLFLPYFFSAVIVGQMIFLLFNDAYGLVNKGLIAIGAREVSWYLEPRYWVKIMVGADVWKFAGYSVIIYLATIVNIDAEQLEASAIDGANRFQQVRRIIIPNLVPTVVMLSLLSVGRFFFGDFQFLWTVLGGHGQLIPTLDVIETYIYRAINNTGRAGDFGVLTAVGFYQSVVGMILVLCSNLAVKRINPGSALF
jgi:putative aldouronate transport system permease protein